MGRQITSRSDYVLFEDLHAAAWLKMTLLAAAETTTSYETPRSYMAFSPPCLVGVLSVRPGAADVRV